MSGAGLRRALVVAHGSPSEPEPQEEFIAALAARAEAQAPGWSVAGATLAMPGALEARVAEGAPEIVYPMFMSDGWFVSNELPRRLGLAGAEGVRVAPSFGFDPALPTLCASVVREAAQAAGLDLARSVLVVAAHGSPNNRRPSEAARAVVDKLAGLLNVGEMRLGFVDEAPTLVDVLTDAAPGLCLPLFASRAGHVTGDLPEAVEEVGYAGPVLDPVGLHEDVAGLIAGALLRVAAEPEAGAA